MPEPALSRDLFRTHITRRNFATTISAAYQAVEQNRIGTSEEDISSADLIELLEDAAKNCPQGSKVMDDQLATIAGFLMRECRLPERTRRHCATIAGRRGFAATKLALTKIMTN